jgi:hypothetical protein
MDAQQGTSVSCRTASTTLRCAVAWPNSGMIGGIASSTLGRERPPPCDWVVGSTVRERKTQYAPSMMPSKPAMSARHAILALLSEGPKSGLELCEELGARIGEVWPVDVEQVYATLRRLERDGLVESA